MGAGSWRRQQIQALKTDLSAAERTPRVVEREVQGAACKKRSREHVVKGEGSLCFQHVIVGREGDVRNVVS